MSGVFPPSLAQLRFLALERAWPGFNQACVITLAGPLDDVLLHRALDAAVRRHGALRTVMGTRGGEPVQIVWPDLALTLSVTDLSPLPEGERMDTARRMAREITALSFDVSAGPGFRFHLLRLDASLHLLAVAMHHVASDGWSTFVLFRDVAAAYGTLAAGEPVPDAPVPQYAAYALAERDRLADGAMRTRIEAAARRIAPVPALALPTDRPRQPTPDPRARIHEFDLSAGAANAFWTMARDAGVTAHTALLAAWAVVLWRWSGQPRIATGGAVGNRDAAHDGVIGYFLNILAFRVDVDPAEPFRDLLARVRDGAIEAAQYRDVPVDALLAALPRPEPGSPAHLSTCFVLHDAPWPVLQAADVEMRMELLEVDVSPWELTISLRRHPGGVHARVLYHTALWDEPTIRAVGEAYARVLESAAANPGLPVATLASVELPRGSSRPGESPGLPDVVGSIESASSVATGDIPRSIESPGQSGSADSESAAGSIGIFRSNQISDKAGSPGTPRSAGSPEPPGSPETNRTADPSSDVNPPSETNRGGMEPLAGGARVHPQSFSQQRLWFLDRMQPGSPVYNLPRAFMLRGELDLEALRRALEEVVRRHEALRTVFAMRDGLPVQVVMPEMPLPLRLESLEEVPEGEREAEAVRRGREEASRPFDLERGPLLRAAVLRLGALDHVLVLVMHHIVSDGWSMGVLFGEMAALYDAFTRGAPSPLPELRMQYAGYAAWQREWLTGDRVNEQVAFWRAQLGGAPATLELPADRPRPAVPSTAGAVHAFTLPAALVQQLRVLSRAEGASPFMALLAAFQAVLARWSGQDDLVVGTPVANRGRGDVEPLIGFFVNTLPMRARVGGADTFRTLLRQARDTALAAYSHTELPFERLVDELRVERSLAHHPVFQVLISLQNDASADQLRLGGAEARLMPVNPDTSRVDLTLALTEHPGAGIRGVVEYSTDLFERDTAERLCRHFARFLEAAAATPDSPVHALELMDAEERRRVLVGWNATATEYPRESTVPALFARAAAAQPGALAIVGSGGPLTYGQLDARSARLARLLAARGVGEGTPVGMAIDRSAGAIVAMLAILRAGGAYVPLDAAYPAERLALMASDAGCAVLVVADAVPAALRGFAGPVVSLAADAEAIAQQGAEPIVPRGGPESMAYVIFTSGSTGRPKGVAVPHRAIVRLVRETDLEDFGPESVVLHASPVAFDASTFEVWAPLLNGGRVAVLPAGPPSLSGLGDALREHGVTWAFLTSGLFNQMVDARVGDLRGLRQLCTGGEAMSIPHVRRAMDALPGVRIRNVYGPTENTSLTTGRFVTAGDLERPAVPIGQPLSNNRVYVLDDALRPVPVGVPGELCVAGDGLALGYVGLPELTAGKFAVVELGDGLTERVYRTGDRVRWLAEGTLEFLGRQDAQVKVRGYRVELGEIEAALRAHPAVGQAAAAVHGSTPSSRRIAAYVVARNGTAPDAAELRAHLAGTLPEHMLPADYVAVDAIPLTPAGKVDRRALPAPAPRRADGAHAAPRNDLERRIAAVWQAVLGADAVGAGDNFFERGGNSLLLLALHERLRNDVPESAGLTVVDLFRHTTIRALAAHLGAASASSTATSTADGPADDRPASASAVEPRSAETEAADSAPEAVGVASPSTDRAVDASAATMRAERGDDRAVDNRVAIIGMSGRFPGAPDLDAFWRNLRAGIESVRFFSRDELLAGGVAPELLDDPKFVPAIAPLGDVDLFDAAFFGLTPLDATILDPQQRLFLECAWEAMEHAGYAPGANPGVGVYAGVSKSWYYPLLLADAELEELTARFSLHIANDKDSLTPRTAYKLGLEGPTITIQSACSTSLVAVHVACRALLGGECEMALAGGTTVRVPQKNGYMHEEGGILSPDGHCRAFDASSRGAVSGSAVGVVLLKRLDRALADGDTIHAVILGSAVNNDGAQRVGFSAPSVPGQARVVRAALAAAGVPPGSVGYVEAHGTGTELGDPVEVAALAEAYAAPGAPPAALASLKSNIGHTDSAAGVSGLIKAVLQLKHGELVPSLHFRTPNPRVDFGRFRVPTALRPWDTGGAPRRAGVSSFGMGGSNAHAVVEEPPVLPPTDPGREWQLLALSARTPTALDAATERLAAHLRAHPEQPLADVAFTLAAGRKPFAHRHAVVVRRGEDAAALLQAPPPGRSARGRAPDRLPSVAFLFPGLGDQYVGMGRGLYDAEPVFRAAVDRCAELLRPHLDGVDLREVIFPSSAAPAPAGAGSTGGIDFRRMAGRAPEPPDASAERLNRTDLAQPAVFVLGYALAQLWESWGIVPEAVMGHSLGEYVAACVAGVLPLDDALALVAARARMIQALPGGAMLAVSLSPDAVRPYLVPGAEVAAENAPEMCTVAGTHEAVAAVERALREAGHAARRLPTTHAFHTAMVRPAAAGLSALAARMRLSPPRIPLVSNLTGTWITDREATDPEYWTRHLCEPVRFSAGVAELARDPDRVLLEVGPGQTLGTFVRQQPPVPGRPAPVVVTSLRHAWEEVADPAYLLHALARLWTAGVAPRWAGVSAGERRRRVPLPTYPFERASYWIRPQNGTLLSSLAGKFGAEEQPLPTASADEQPIAEAVPAMDAPASVVRESSAVLPLPQGSYLGEGVGGRGPTPPALDGDPVAPSTSTDAVSPLADDATDLRFHVPSWRRTLAPTAATPHGSWLVLDDGEGTGEHVAERLRAAGCTVALAAAGTAFGGGGGRWTLRPGEAGDLRAVVDALDAAGRPLDHVLHLWALPAAEGDERANDALERWSVRGWHALRALAQVLAEDVGESPVRVQVFASQTQAVESGDRLVPEKALLAGALRSMAQEQPRLSCRLVDFPVARPSDAGWQARAERIAAEALAGAGEPVAAWRGHHRYAQAWEPARLGGAPVRTVREGGVYLVTGGLGSVGLTIAGWLAREHRARLVLTSRTALPPRDEWGAWLAAHPEDDATSRRIAAIRRMESFGASVMAEAVDVGDEAAMRALIGRVHERWGRIDGVVHAAGATRGRSIWRRLAALDGADAAEQWRAKVVGTRVLQRVLPPGVAFCYLVSSVASVLAGLGLGAYAAANAFLDAFAAEQHRAGHTGWFAVGIDGWPDASPGGTGRRHAGGAPLTREQAEACFQRTLASSTVPHLLHALGDLDARLAQWVPSRPSDAITSAEPARASAERAAASPASTETAAMPAGGANGIAATHQPVSYVVTPPGAASASTEHTPSTASSPTSTGRSDALVITRTTRDELSLSEPWVAPREGTERRLQDLWTRLLGVEGIGAADNFFELGGHSLLGTRLIARIRAEMGVELPIQALFRSPTIRAMAGEIATLMLHDADAGELDRALDEVLRLTPEQVEALLDSGDAAPAAGAGAA